MALKLHVFGDVLLRPARRGRKGWELAHLIPALSELPSLSFWSKADLGAEASLDTLMFFRVVWEHAAGFNAPQWL